MKRLLYILFLLFLLAACRENKKEQFARLVQEWQGKEIVFPQDMVFTRFVTEQVEYRIPDAEYKVLIYVDSTGLHQLQIATAEMERIDRPCRFDNKQQHPVHLRLPVRKTTKSCDTS